MADAFVAQFDDKEVVEFISNLDKKTKSIKDGKKEYVGLLSAIVYADVIRHFEQERGSNGPWDKWSQFYRDQMEEQGKGGNKILQDTGRLRNTFKPQKNRVVPNGILWFNDAKTKTGFPYAAAHEYGGSRLPMRNFMWLSKQAMDKIGEQTLQFMLEKGI